MRSCPTCPGEPGRTAASSPSFRRKRCCSDESFLAEWKRASCSTSPKGTITRYRQTFQDKRYTQSESDLHQLSPSSLRFHCTSDNSIKRKICRQSFCLLWYIPTMLTPVRLFITVSCEQLSAISKQQEECVHIHAYWILLQTFIHSVQYNYFIFY